jgi:hypothetical protein
MSAHDPLRQVAWDSSSLGAVMFCPRYYQYTILEGWSGDQTDLQFGGFAATGFELYQKARLEGLNKDDALLRVVREMMRATQGWGGEWETMWHCEGLEKYKNKKGNPAKCPYAHAGMWFPGDKPDVCGECGSTTSQEKRYLPIHPSKNRIGLIRMLIWYIDDQPEEMADGLHPYIFPDGTKAVELSMRIPLPWTNAFGEQYILTGHLDYIGVFGEEMFPVDNKTTAHPLDAKFFGGYSPHYQMDTYDLMVTMQFPDLPLKGILIDAAQVLVGGAKFARHAIYKTDAQREEHWEQIKFWINLAEQFAIDKRWPMNKRNCWLCPFKNVCNKDPEERERYLNVGFTKRPVWDPLVPR